MYFNSKLLCFILLLSIKYYAQKNNLNFSYPIDRSIVITGNYGELRPNHFHAGLDFSTDPNLNLPIKSIANGYVSRIKISSGGYGKCLYITHPNGYVSVYAHQKKYANKIDYYIKQKQLTLKQNEIEIFPIKNDLPITQGEVIGYSGNSGSSTGPHLHFEIRDEKSEIPLNPLLFFNVKDDVKPTITHIAIFNSTDTNNITLQELLPVNKKNTVALNYNTFCIGFVGYDKANSTASKNNIYEVKLFVDYQLMYNHQLNNISFDNGRYVNYFSEKYNGQKIQKCFTPNCQTIGIYKTVVNGGKIIFTDTLYHTITVECFDENKNKTNYTFRLKAKEIQGYLSSKKQFNAYCNTDFNLKKDEVEVFIKANTLIKPTFITAQTINNNTILIGNKNELLLQSFKFSVKKNNVITNKETKLVLLNNDNCLIGNFENGWFKTESKSFGSFTFSYDTIAPTISFVNNSKNKKNYSFKVTDSLSGIANYNIYINNDWCAAEYDAKTATITCYLTAEQQKTVNKVKLEVLDKVGNLTTLQF